MPYPKEFACHFIGVGGVVFHKEKVLLVKLTYGPAKRKLLIPGGMVDCGEIMSEAVTREIEEETGLQTTPLGIIGIRDMVRESDKLTDLYCVFICELISDPNLLKADNKEAEKVCWYPLDNLDSDEVSEYTRVVVKEALKNKLMKNDPERDERVKKQPRMRKYEHFFN